MHSELGELFTQEKLRFTKPRRQVFETLQGSETPLSIADIAKKCTSIDRVSIYRTIDLFMKLNIATAVPVGWKQRYELTDLFKTHHHHLYCIQCGKLIDVHSRQLETIVAHITAEYHFTPTQHKFEISGLCENCN